jgi:regulator of RNase E activity RraA
MDSTTVSDALDKLGIPGQCLGIKPLDRSFRAAGPAFTIRYVPCGTRGGTVGDYIDDLPAGTVVALDNQGRMDATVWGDILTIVASRKNLGGTVIDGVCRDAPRAIELNYPIFARGSHMRTGKDRVAVDAMQVSISIGGVRVDPGDYMLCDWDGVVVVPRERIDQAYRRGRGSHPRRSRARRTSGHRAHATGLPRLADPRGRLEGLAMSPMSLSADLLRREFDLGSATLHEAAGKHGAPPSAIKP